jgi:hypothetical protein
MEYYDKPPFGSDNELGTGACRGYAIAFVVTVLTLIGIVILWRLGL